jgi:hypothetical protein
MGNLDIKWMRTPRPGQPCQGGQPLDIEAQSPGPPAPQDLKHSDFNFSHSIIVSFFFASHSAFLNSHSTLFEYLASPHSISFREQSMALPGHAIFRQSRQGSPQPVGNNPIKANVTMIFRIRKRDIETIGFPQVYALNTWCFVPFGIPVGLPLTPG